MALAFVGFQQPAQNVHAQSPRIVASAAGDWFWTTDFVGEGELHFSIYETEDTDASLLWEGSKTADEWGFVSVGYEDHAIDLLPGYYLVVTDGTSTKELVLEAISMEVFDTELEYMKGTAPAGRDVWAAAGPQEYQTGLWVTADPVTGVWSADFTTVLLDITEDMRTWSYAQIFDEDGDANEADPPPPPPNPRFVVFPEWEFFDGLDWPDGAVVSIAVEGKPECSLERESWGGFFNGNFPEGCDLEVGDFVTFTDGETIRTHTVHNLAVTEVDAEADAVAGSADPDVLVYVWAHCCGEYEVQPVAGGDGAWLADFTAVGFDLQPGMDGRSEARDEQGNATAVDWNVPWPVWRDEFDGELQEPWNWVNEDPDKWGLHDGFLRIDASSYATGGENLLLRPVVQGDFVIKTHLFFEPDTNFQFAGLVIFQDEDNFLQLGRAFCDVPDLCVGNGIYFDYVGDGTWVDGNFGTPVDSPSEAYLRLERRGEMVKAFFSYEGVTWFEIGAHWIPAEFQVNAVGLTASQDNNTPDWDVPADFDFFELTEGWGFLPEGFHDYDQGDVPNWACNAGGWAVDPDDRETDLWVELTVDGEPLTDWLLANEYRPDLEENGGCIGGSCGFSTYLWDLISPYETHIVAAYAQDFPSGEWVLLSASPKELTCRTYDIYIFDPETGETRQLTDQRDGHEYNPRWSPDGKKIVHDHWDLDWNAHGVYITDVKSGLSVPLAGADRGSYPAWSPSGRWIAFDRGADGDYRLFIVPPTGGAPRLVREDAFMASWAPNSQRLAFHQPSDGSIRTTDLNGGNVTLVAERGNGPAWSPDGEWIAYELDGDIWKVRVNNNGAPLGDPIQVTSGPGWEGRMTWSNNGKTLAFHAGVGGDTDIWTVPAAGGAATWLTGAPGFGDYDPNYSFNGRYIGYSSFSPAGQAEREWVAVYMLDRLSGSWSEGEHHYYVGDDWGHQGDPQYFTVSGEEPTYEGYVLLRAWAMWAQSEEGCVQISAVNPEQPTRFHSGWTTPEPMTYQDAGAYFSDLHAWVVWDDGEPVDLQLYEIRPFSADTWQEYFCACTNKD